MATVVVKMTVKMKMKVNKMTLSNNDKKVMVLWRRVYGESRAELKD